MRGWHEERPQSLMSAEHPTQARRIVLRAARVFDGHADVPRPGCAVIIEGNRITALMDESPALADAEAVGWVIELGDVTLMPGMADLHTHLTAWANRWPRPYDPGTRYAFQACANLAAAVSTGVTTIRDVGSFEDIAVAARDAVELGVIEGPRVIPCRKAVTITGGLGPTTTTMHLGRTEGWMTQANGADALRGAVRSEIREGAEWIKLYFERGNWTTEELAAAVAAAHSDDVRVAIHANRSTAIKSAIEAGVDTIEHGLELEEEDLRRMTDAGIAWIPTLFIVENRCRVMEEDAAAAARMPGYLSLLELRDRHRRIFQRALSSGVEIGAGVDALPDEGGVPFAAIPDELELMVELGMTPSAALRAATSNAARILGLQDTIGSLEPGHTADVIAVRGNPQEDISSLHDVAFVMKDGKVLRDNRGASVVSVG